MTANLRLLRQDVSSDKGQGSTGGGHQVSGNPESPFAQRVADAIAAEKQAEAVAWWAERRRGEGSGDGRLIGKDFSTDPVLD
jgi:hypothetical protein